MGLPDLQQLWAALAVLRCKGAHELRPSMAFILAAVFEKLVRDGHAEKLHAAEAVMQDKLTSCSFSLTAILEEVSDEALAIAVQKDFFRKLAFEVWLVQRYEERLVRWFYRLTGNAEQARDLTQDLYIKFWAKAADNYDPTRLFCPFLKVVCHNMAVDERRRRSREPGTVPPDSALELPDPGPSPEQEAECRAERKRVDAALSKLPEERRQILSLSMSGKTRTEIALLLNMDLGRVDRLLHKARRDLENLLGLE